MQGYSPRLLALCERCPQAMLSREYWSIKDFVLVKEVGSGAASTVYYALCRKSTQPVAIKMYLKSKLSKLNRRQVEREINIHSSLGHPHIIDFYAAFEDDDRIYLVQEYAAGGDLFDDVKRRGGRLPEREVVQQVLYPYLKALAYLHERGIIHRDIKPENTVFTKERVLKVTDFGLAINANTERPVTRLGTLDYMAPEVLRCPDKHSPEDNKDRVDLEYDNSVDAWAMGVLAYELIVGRPPFGMSCREATMRAIVAASPSIPEWMSPGAADFIRAALQRTSARRLPVEQLLQHPWISSNVAGIRLPQPVTPARNPSCGADAAAAMADVAAATTTIIASPSAGGAAAVVATLAGEAAAALSPAKTLFYHPSGPYKHLMATPQSCNSASASELGCGRPGGGGIAVTAAMAYGSDQRPAKRQVQRCQSASMDAGTGSGGGGTAAATTAAVTPSFGLPAQQGSPHVHVHRLHDNTSYWMTDGNGFRPDPLIGLGGSGDTATEAPCQLLQLQQQTVAPAVAAAAAEAVDDFHWGSATAATPGGHVATNSIGGSVPFGRAQDFYQSQIGRAFADATTATTASVGDGGVIAYGVDAMQQQLGLQAIAGLQHQQYQQLLQMQYSQQQQHVAMLHQQHQHQVFLFQQQQQQQQQQQRMSPVDVQQQQQQQQQLEVDPASSGECTTMAAPMEPSIPPRTAADYYRLHLEDVRAAGMSCRTSPGGSRSLSRSFTARHASRTASNAGGGTQTATAAGSGSGGLMNSSMAARLLRNVSSSSSGGSMKRRTPDTHDWDLPLLPTAPLAQQLQLQYMPAGSRTAGGGVQGSPLSRSSDAFAASGGAAAFYTGSGATAAAAATAMPADISLATPFSQYAGPSAPPPPPMLPPMPTLGSSLSFTSYGSTGGRPSRLSKAFRRMDSLDPGEGGLGFGAEPGSDGSRSGDSGSGSGPLPAALPLAPQYSGATAAMAALDQLTLASGAPPATAIAAATAAAAAATAAAAINTGVSWSSAELQDGRANNAAMVAVAMQVAACMDSGLQAAPAPSSDIDSRVAAAAAAYNTLSDSSHGSSTALSTALTAASLGGTSAPYSASACSYGYSAASGSSTLTVAGCSGAGLSSRAPSITNCGAFTSAAQGMAALRLSLPTPLPRLGIPAAGSTTGSSCGGGGGAGGPTALGLRSHPLSSPQVTPWSTPLSSPAAGRIPRVHSQPPGTSSFNDILDLMEAEGVLTSAEALPNSGMAAGGGGGGGGIGTSCSSRCGSQDALALAWAGQVAGGGSGGDGQAPMQVDEAGRAAAFSHMCRTVAGPGGQEFMAGGSAASSMHFSAASISSGGVPVKQMTPEDRWAAAWAAAAAASSGGGGSRLTPTAPTTPPSLGRTGTSSFPGNGAGSAAAAAASGAAATAANCAVHAPSPLGRDQPYQQALAAAMQQHIRSRSLNRFQLEQMGLTSAPYSSSGGGGGGGGAAGAVAAAAIGLHSPFVASPPISPRGASVEGTAAATNPFAAGFASGGSGGSGGVSSGGGGGSNAAFGNRLGQQTISPSTSLRGPLYNPALQVMGASVRPYPHYGVGAVQCSGNAVASPSPLGLRNSRSRPSNGSSDDTSNNPLPGVGGMAACTGSTAASRPSDASYERPNLH